MMHIEMTCKRCKRRRVMKVPLEGYLAWKSGLKLLQDAMPYVSDGDREMLRSGICETCFDDLFKEEE